MTKSATFAKGALAVVAGAVALGAAATASAQPYSGYNSGYSSSYYGGCQRAPSGRGVAGALIGGAAGAALGSQIAASGHRSDGSLVGGLLGAFAGAAVGHSTAGCSNTYAAAPPPPPPPPPSSYYDNSYQPYADGDYAPAPYVSPGAYDRGDEAYGYGRRSEAFRVASRPDADGCSLAESSVYLPDGRVQKRFVRVCMDSRGRYQVVD